MSEFLEPFETIDHQGVEVVGPFFACPSSDESAPDLGLPGDESVEPANTTAQGPTRSDARRLADLTAGNAKTEGELIAQGVRLNETALIALQVRALLKLVVGDDPTRRMAWDLAYQEVVAEGLAEVTADLAKRKQASRLVVPRAGVPNLNGH